MLNRSSFPEPDGRLGAVSASVSEWLENSDGLLWCVLWAVIALEIFTLVAVTRPTFLWSPDQYTFATTAYQLYTGQGYTHPVAHTVPQLENFPPPYSNRPPVFALLTAVGFAIVGVSENVPFAVNAGAYAIGAAVVYKFAADLQGGVAGHAGAGMFLAVPFVFTYAYSGLSDLLFSVLFIATLYAVYKRRFVGGGVLLALTYLTRNNMLFSVPVFLAYLVFEDDVDRRDAARFFGTSAIVALPWWLRNLYHFGTPLPSNQKYLVASYTSMYPGLTAYSKQVDPIGFALAHPDVLASKILGNIGEALTSMPKLHGGMIILTFAAIGLSVGAERFRPLAALCVGLVAIHVLALSVIHFELRYLLFVSLLGCVFAGVGVGYLFDVLDETPATRVAIVGVVVLACSMGLLAIADTSVWGADHYQALQEDAGLVGEETQQGDIIVGGDLQMRFWLPERTWLGIPETSEPLVDGTVGEHYLLTRPDAPAVSERYGAGFLEDCYTLVVEGQQKKLYRSTCH